MHQISDNKTHGAQRNEWGTDTGHQCEAAPFIYTINPKEKTRESSRHLPLIKVLGNP